MGVMEAFTFTCLAIVIFLDCFKTKERLEKKANLVDAELEREYWEFQDKAKRASKK